MKPELKTATLEVEIPNRALARTLLEKWSHHSGVELTILRGRVSADEARYELEVRGSVADVARIVRQSAPWDASRRFLNPVPSGALA